MNENGQLLVWIARTNTIAWTHPAEVDALDVDCTDMDDAEFEAFVMSKALA